MGKDRKRDMSLVDCPLTRKGIKQAREVISTLGPQAASSIELVITSPLRRALETSLYAFATHAIIVHYAICEIGSDAERGIPENIPTPLDKLVDNLSHFDLGNTDFESNLPEDWPRVRLPTRGIIPYILQRDERVVAVVCHYNVIRALLGPSVRPGNAAPIKVWLSESGEMGVFT